MIPRPPQAPASDGGPQDADARAASLARKRRRPARHPPSEAEVARLVAEFHARGGSVTPCPPACVLPIRNGAGFDAATARAVAPEPVSASP